MKKYKELVCVIIIVCWLGTVRPFSLPGHSNAAYQSPANFEHCEPLTLEFCEGLPYNLTRFPNMLNHQKQEDAALELSQFKPLLKVNCSPNLQLFLCSLYAPICTGYRDLDILPPCNSLCVSAREGCENIMNKFGFDWPKVMDCSDKKRFPDYEINKLCVHGGSKSRPVVGRGQHKPPVRTAAVERPEIVPTAAWPRYECPARLRAKYADYKLLIGNISIPYCGFPCHSVFFSQDDRQLVTSWVSICSVVCLMSTLLTILTFFADRDRFHYPERAVAWLAFCYFAISVAYLAGVLLEDKVACNYEAFDLAASQSHHVSRTENGGKIGSNDYGIGMLPLDEVLRKPSFLITQGAKIEACAILAMFVYFFTISASLWWVVLTFSWFLSAYWKWSTESIERYSSCFHCIAWGVAGVLAVIVLATQNIDGDIWNGVCSVGNLNPTILNYFVIGPLGICFILGMGFFCIGTLSLHSTRSFFKREHKNAQHYTAQPHSLQIVASQSEKLEKLLLRMIIFSVFYNVPAVITLAFYFYQSFNFRIWMANWYHFACRNDQEHRFYGFADDCAADRFGRSWREAPEHPMVFEKPELAVFLVLKLMVLAAGIMTSFWIFSSKTLLTWSEFFARLCPCCLREMRGSREHMPVPVCEDQRQENQQL